MSLIAALLIIVSALMHASWNFISKRRNPSLAFYFVMAVTAAIVTAPILIIYRRSLQWIPSNVWGLIMATGVAQMVYFFGLAGAYKRGDMSLAYPLARAIPVLLIAGISLMSEHRKEIGRPGLVGMALIFMGCMILPLHRFQKIHLRNYFGPVSLMAFVAAIGTTGYTLIDDQALRQLRDVSAIQLSNMKVTLLFISLQTLSTALMLGLGTVFIHAERQQLTDIIGNRAMQLSGLATGVVIVAAYGLVLMSMAYVTNVSYVAAFRQLSIPIGAVLGLTLQGEPRHPPRIVGICIVTIGLILVGRG